MRKGNLENGRYAGFKVYKKVFLRKAKVKGIRGVQVLSKWRGEK
jgi:hypothetical protein